MRSNSRQKSASKAPVATSLATTCTFREGMPSAGHLNPGCCHGPEGADRVAAILTRGRGFSARHGRALDWFCKDRRRAVAATWRVAANAQTELIGPDDDPRRPPWRRWNVISWGELAMRRPERSVIPRPLDFDRDPDPNPARGLPDPVSRIPGAQRRELIWSAILFNCSAMAR